MVISWLWSFPFYLIKGGCLFFFIKKNHFITVSLWASVRGARNRNGGNYRDWQRRIRPEQERKKEAKITFDEFQREGTRRMGKDEGFFNFV